MRDSEQPTPDAKRWRENLRGELDGTALYLGLANAERDPARAEIFRQLAQTERRHAAHWRGLLEAHGLSTTVPDGPSVRTRALTWAARLLGAPRVLPLVIGLERADQRAYQQQPDAARLPADEHDHARTLSKIVEGGRPGAIAAGEYWHRGRDAGGGFRAGIFGLNDGLASNLSLIMGVAGADPARQVIVLAGVAGLLAGAFSMGAGEYISMTQQREMFARQIRLEQDELESHPAEEQDELSLIYQAKGVPRDQAEAMAAQIMQDPAQALDTLAREELGLNPQELGSPWAAAISSFLLFSAGALVPLLPFLLRGQGTGAILLSAALSGIALFSFGAVLSLFTGKNPIYSGMRTLLLTSVAAAVTHLIGRIIGVAVS